MGAEKKEVDLFVIGAGSGGLAAAKRAAGHGARVAIAEADRVGGTCVIRGCIPKKLMVYASQLGAMRRLGEAYGWDAGPASCAWPQLKARRDAVVAGLEANHGRALEAAGVQAVRGRAVLQDAH